MSLEQKWVGIIFPEEKHENEQPEWREQQETFGSEIRQELWAFKDIQQYVLICQL